MPFFITIIFKFWITTNNNYNEYKNVSIIKLGKCEETLKNYHNISKNETLIIFKNDIYQEGRLTPKVNYEIYDMKDKNKLELDFCKNIKIEIILPYIIEDNNTFKYNISSEYYNEICYSYAKHGKRPFLFNQIFIQGGN